MKLEREFIFESLINKMTKYYEVIDADSVNLSGIYYKSPRDKAIEDVENLYNRDKNYFYKMYQELARV